MYRKDWQVDEHAIRPKGPPDKCFYCGRALGDQHRPNCSIRRRTVVVRTIFQHVIDVPETWETSTIESTEGPSCADNNINELIDLAERLEKAERCTCGMLKIEFVREATEDDEQRSELFVRELPS